MFRPVILHFAALLAATVHFAAAAQSIDTSGLGTRVPVSFWGFEERDWCVKDGNVLLDNALAKTKLTTIRHYAGKRDINAILLLGSAYDLGVKEAPGITAVKKDRKKASEIFEIASKSGHPFALSAHGFSFEHGIGQIKSPDKAAALYFRSAGAGCAKGLHNYARAYMHGIGRTKSTAKALQFYHESAVRGYVRAQMELGSIFRFGRPGISKNTHLSLYWYRKAASNGNQFAFQFMAEMYLDKSLKIYNPTVARRYYREAAKLGNKHAQLMLGSMDLKPASVPAAISRPPSKWGLAAKDWSIMPSDQLLVKAQYMKRRSAIKTAAAAGDLDALVLTGFAYQHGYGEVRDSSRMGKVFQAAAEKGHPRGMHAFGNYLDYYLSNKSMAEKWYYRSYEAGNAMGAHGYAWRVDVRCYRNVHCDSGHFDSVMKAVRFAASQGHVRAKEFYATLSRKGSGYGTGGATGGRSCRKVYDPKCTPTGGCQYRDSIVCN